MFQRLPIALEQVKAGNTSDNLLNEICQKKTYFVSSKRNYSKRLQQYNEFKK